MTMMLFQNVASRNASDSWELWPSSRRRMGAVFTLWLLANGMKVSMNQAMPISLSVSNAAHLHMRLCLSCSLRSHSLFKLFTFTPGLVDSLSTFLKPFWFSIDLCLCYSIVHSFSGAVYLSYVALCLSMGMRVSVCKTPHTPR